MNNLDDLKESSILVVGLGKTGMSVVRFLDSQKINFSVVDGNSKCENYKHIASQYPNITIYTQFDAQVFEQFDVIVLSPGVALSEYAVKNAIAKGTKVIGDVEIFSWIVNKPVVGITGSNGKSTVVAMLADVGERAGCNIHACGNFGDPVLDCLADQSIDIYAIELSSFQMETTDNLYCDVSTVLNISEDHMDRYSNIEEYAQVKRKIYDNSRCCIVKRSDKRTWPSYNDKNRHVVYVAEQEPLQKDVYGFSDVDGVECLMRGHKQLMSVDSLSVVGKHNAQNALVVLAIADELNLDTDVTIQALQDFTGLAHRVEFVCKSKGVRWFNDSKGTNVGATVNAVKGLSSPVVLIAGGEGKGADFNPLAKTGKCLKAAVLIGRDASIIGQVLQSTGIPVMFASTMNEAVKAARDLSIDGDVVLLSPACASFDMFKNFEERGERFIHEIKQEVGQCI